MVRCVGGASEGAFGEESQILLAFDAQDEDEEDDSSARGQAARSTRLLWEQTHASEPFWWQKKEDPRGEPNSDIGVDLLATCDREAQFLWQARQIIMLLEINEEQVSRLLPLLGDEEEGFEEYRRSLLSSRSAPHHNRRVELVRRTHVAATDIASYRADCVLVGGEEAGSSSEASWSDEACADRYAAQQPPPAFWSSSWRETILQEQHDDGDRLLRRPSETLVLPQEEHDGGLRRRSSSESGGCVGGAPPTAESGGEHEEKSSMRIILDEVCDSKMGTSSSSSSPLSSAASKSSKGSGKRRNMDESSRSPLGKKSSSLKSRYGMNRSRFL
jgi:hypothetical protein